MANPKPRMSDIFTSSTDKNTSTSQPTTTPPYSSEGPTLPIVGGTKRDPAPNPDAKAGKKRKAADQSSNIVQPPSIHPSLYTPWQLLPPELLKLLDAQTRLRGQQNVIPIAFTKNQNVKSGINKLKMLLGAAPNTTSTIATRDAMTQKDMVIAVSAQGEGTAKLVGIVDMARRIVAPTNAEQKVGVETWWMYTTLTSVLVERPTQNRKKEVVDALEEEEEEEEEEDAFEPMDIDDDGKGKKDISEKSDLRKAPVLTVWMTKKRIPEFRHAFGEQSFQVREVEDLN